MNPLVRDPSALYLSASRLEGTKSCWRKDYIGRQLTWGPDRESHHFGVGKAVHRALNEIWIEACRPDGKADPKRAFALAEEAFHLEWERLGLPLGQDLLEADYLRAKRPDIIVPTLEHYIKVRWPWMQRVELLAVEYRFEVPLGTINGRKVIYIAVMDKVIRDGKLVKGVEHKTTGSYSGTGLRSDTIKGFFPNLQVEGYAWGLFQGWQSREIFVDVLVLAETKRDGAKKIIGVLPVEPSLPKIESWERNQREWAARLVDAESRLAAGVDIDSCYPYNEGACMGKYGECSNRTLCLMFPDIRELPPEPIPGYAIKEREGDLDWFFEEKIPTPWWLTDKKEEQV